MSDTYGAEAPFDPSAFVLREQRRATSSALGSLEDDPEKAARAQELSDATGDHPAVVYGNLEDYEAQHKATLTNQLLTNNKYLRQYVDDHPLASKISNDDYGQLDEVSSGLQKAGFVDVPGVGPVPTNQNTVLAKAFEGFKENFDAESLGSDYKKLGEALVSNPLFNNIATVQAVQAGALALEGSARLVGGVVGGLSAGVGEAYKQLGGSEAWGNRLTRDLIIMANVAMSGQAGLHGIVSPEVHAEISKFHEAVKPYLEAGVEPPLGVHPEIDKMKVEQSKRDLSEIETVFAEAQKSATRERSPDIFANFIAKHTDTKIGVSAEAVAKLYGDKPPTPDGPLGFIPDLADQLAVGGDVQIPLSDWLARVDPEVAKELHDDIRVRPGGVTVNEAEALREHAVTQKAMAGLEPEPVEGIPEDVQEPLHIAEQATESLRQATALKPLFDIPKEAIPGSKAERGFEFTTNQGLKARIIPTEELLEHEKVLDQKVGEILGRIAGDTGYELGTADSITMTGHSSEVQGAYTSFEKALPVIMYSVHADNAPRTVRHEAIHFLRDYNFFTKGEWATLEQEALAQDWIRKHGIDERYGKSGLDKAGMLEEAIADEFGDWGSQNERLEAMKDKYSKGVQAVFEKMREFFRQIEQAIKEAFGHSPKVEELFQQIESGQIAQRGPGRPSDGAMDIRPKAQAKGPAQGELDVTRMGDRPAFDAGTYPGLTKRQSEIISRRIAERNADDAKRQAERVLRNEQKRLGAEWKSNREVMHQEVSEEIANRPDIAADRLLRTGELYGDKLGDVPKIKSEALSDEQKASLPKEFVSRDGVHPDDLAGLFGYISGDVLVSRLGELEKAREASGMKPDAYVRRVVDAETDRRMEAKYGDLGANVLEAAKDHILSETQLDLLHDETVVLAEKAGQELPIKKDALKGQLRQMVDKLAMGDIDSDKMLAAAGRAGRAAEDAWIKQDYPEALKAKQQQTYAIHIAKMQAEIEKARDQWDRTAKKFSKREVSGVSPEYTNFIHSLLLRLDEQVRRTPEDLAEEIDKGAYKTFPDFVAAKEADLRDLHVPDFLLDPAFQKPLDKLTVEEFRRVHDALRAMEFNGRNELTLDKAGEKTDLKEVINAMVEKIASVGEVKRYPVDRKPNWYVDRAKSWWWSGINVESMLNRLDRDSPRGIFYQYIARQFTDASNHKDRMVKDYQKKISELGKVPDLDKKVDNALFTDPNTWEKDEQGKPIPGTGDPLAFRRRNVLGILQNVGNPSNLKKLAEGYGLKPEQVVDWLKSVTTKEDWDRAQKIGDVFAELFEEANKMSRRISGVGIERLPLEELTSPHGDTYPGWYNPVKYDPLRPGQSRALIGRDVEEEGFFRATTPQGYTEKRTGYIAPVELNMDIVPIRMKQMIHDIAMRETVQQLSKVFYNPDFNRAMIKHYGKHQAASFVPFLRDIANASNFRSMEQYMGDSALEHFRQNTIATLIGLNPSTVLKHGPTALVNSLTEVGVANWAREFATLLNTDEATSKSNWSMAMDKSEELSRRMRNYSELISGHGSEVNVRGTSTKFETVREFLMHVGATPVSISDLLSAVPTFLAKYKSEIEAGTDEGMAVSIANRAVRRAHGSSVLSNKPSIARNNNAIGAYFSSLYGFFSHMQQKQYELAWKARDLLSGEKSGDTETMRHAPDLLKGFMSYIIFPALVEELVTPTNEHGEKETWGRKATWAMINGVSSSFIGVRDFVHAVVNVRDPQSGLIGTTLKTGADIARDFRKGKQIFNKAEAGNLIKHTFALTGVLSGLTNAQEGRAAEYLYKYYQGQEKPRGAWDAAVGLRYGTTAGHSRSFEQWRKQMAGGH